MLLVIALAVLMQIKPAWAPQMTGSLEWRVALRCALRAPKSIAALRAAVDAR